MIKLQLLAAALLQTILESKVSNFHTDKSIVYHFLSLHHLYWPDKEQIDALWL